MYFSFLNSIILSISCKYKKEAFLSSFYAQIAVDNYLTKD